MSIQIPGLTIQPIIENAVIHAIEPLEQGGTITFRIRDEGSNVMIEIEDEGSGISEEKISQIVEDRFSSQEGDGHSTGIGFGNVISRLRLFYGREDIMEIQSEVGKGTKVILKSLKVREAG